MTLRSYKVSPAAAALDPGGGGTSIQVLMASGMAANKRDAIIIWRMIFLWTFGAVAKRGKHSVGYRTDRGRPG